MSNQQHLVKKDDKEEEKNSEKRNILIFQLDSRREKFKIVEVNENVALHELLYHDTILLFFDNENSRVWMWQGNKTIARMKFLSAQLAPQIRNKHGVDFSITTIDDGDEPLAFKNFIGLV